MEYTALSPKSSRKSTFELRESVRASVSATNYADIIDVSRIIPPEVHPIQHQQSTARLPSFVSSTSSTGVYFVRDAYTLVGEGVWVGTEDYI